MCVPKQEESNNSPEHGSSRKLHTFSCTTVHSANSVTTSEAPNSINGLPFHFHDRTYIVSPYTRTSGLKHLTTHRSKRYHIRLTRKRMTWSVYTELESSNYVLLRPHVQVHGTRDFRKMAAVSLERTGVYKLLCFLLSYKEHKALMRYQVDVGKQYSLGLERLFRSSLNPRATHFHPP